MTHSDIHHYECRLVWTGAEKGGTVNYESYSREHRIEIKGKPPLTMTSDVAFRGDGAIHNPEDLLLAALSACHFLSYVAFAARSGVVVLAYEDQASGTMKTVDKKTRFTEVVLRPKVTLQKGSDPDKARALHERAHGACFIANSVNFPVRNEPIIEISTT